MERSLKEQLSALEQILEDTASLVWQVYLLVLTGEWGSEYRYHCRSTDYIYIYERVAFRVYLSTSILL